MRGTNRESALQSFPELGNKPPSTSEFLVGVDRPRIGAPDDQPLVHKAQKDVHALEHPSDLKNLDAVLKVRVIDLEHVFTAQRSTVQVVQPSLSQRAHAVDSPDTLLHRGRSPGDAVVVDRSAERVQILALLEQIRRDQYEGI